MKKFKLITAALLASTLVLAGCGDTKTDPTPEPTPTPVVDPAIKTIKITGAPSELAVGSSVKLTASVTVEGGAAKGVKWSVDDETLASLSSTTGTQVTLTAKAEGKVKVTITSNFDSSKTASVEINLIDQGFDPTFIDYGYTYSKEFPVEQIQTFIGVGEYGIIELDSLDGGCYYYDYPGDEEEGYAPAFEVVVDGIRYEDYADALTSAGFTRVYYSSSTDGYEAVDPTGMYTVAMYADYDSESYQECAPTYIDFYRSEDVWDDGTLTTDTAWNSDHYAEDTEDYVDIMEDYLAQTPFVKMGQNYVINFNDLSLTRMLAEYFGLDPADYPDQLLIYDYTIRDDIFNNYGATLIEAGYEECEDASGTYYVKNVGINSYVVYTTFTEGGNTIVVEKGAAILDAWPTTYVDEFVTNEIGSKHSIPAYDKTEGASFTMSISEQQVSDEKLMVAKVNVDQVAKTEAASYMSDICSLGYTVGYTSGTDDTYPTWTATQGKIVINAIFVENYDSSTETYDENNGELVFYIYGDDTRHEEPGIYLPEEGFALMVDGEFTLDLEVVEIAPESYVSTSSEPSVATIDGLKVTPVGPGTTTITVSVPDTEYSATMELTISDQTHFEICLDECNEFLASEGATEDLVLPEPVNEYCEGEVDTNYDCYSFYLSSEVTVDEYLEQLETAGFEITQDGSGYYCAVNDFAMICPWNPDEGELEIDVYSYEPVVEGATFDYGEISSTSATVGDFTVEADIGSGKSDPIIHADGELRLYDGNTLTISSEGDPITSIDFYSCDCSSKVGADFTASEGELTETEYGYHWEGEAYEVTFTSTKADSDHKQTHFILINVNGGGQGGGGGGGEVSEEAKEFMEDLIYAITGEEAEYDVDYWDDDGLWTYFYGEDLEDDIDNMYSLLSSSFDCDEPVEFEEGIYGFIVYNEDASYYAAIYSYDYSGSVVIEIDVYELVY